MDLEERERLIHEHRLPQVFAVQSQNSDEPWGWETIVVYAGDEEGKRAACEHRDELFVQAHHGRGYRAVSMIVWPNQEALGHTGYGDPEMFDEFNIAVLPGTDG